MCVSVCVKLLNAHHSLQAELAALVAELESGQVCGLFGRFCDERERERERREKREERREREREREGERERCSFSFMTGHR